MKATIEHAQGETTVEDFEEIVRRDDGFQTLRVIWDEPGPNRTVLASSPDEQYYREFHTARISRVESEQSDDDDYLGRIEV